MKRQKSYFLVIPKNGEVLFASWKIIPEEAPKKISKNLTGDASLILEVYTTANSIRTKIDSIPIHGLENSWHIFTKKQYRGKRLVFTLCHRGARGKITEMFTSKEINVPLSGDSIAQLNKSAAKDLFELSRINLEAFTGSGKNTSW